MTEQKNEIPGAFTDYNETLKIAADVMLQELFLCKEDVRVKLTDIVSRVKLSEISQERTIDSYDNIMSTGDKQILQYLQSCIFLIKMVIGVEEYSKFLLLLSESATTQSSLSEGGKGKTSFTDYLQVNEWYVALILMRISTVKLLLSVPMPKASTSTAQPTK